MIIQLLAAMAFLGVPANRIDDSVEVTFAFFGCNRIDGKDYEARKDTNPSSANVPQLRQNLEDVARLAPDFLFFGGDLVMGYADDQGEVLERQFSAWTALVGSMPRSSKTQFVVMPGNHELNRKVGDKKLPNPVTDGVWERLVGRAGYVPSDATGPTAWNSPEDDLVGDQSKSSFSFTRGTVHFVVLNTDTRVTTLDTATGETKIGMTPTHWLDGDLDTAEQDPKVKVVVVMGHRNVIDPDSVKGDAPIDAECGVPMVRSLESHPKVRAYICAHVHAFDISTIGTDGLRQVCFGNGGSKLEKDWNPTRGRTFGFGYFKVYADGSLGVVPYLRPEPKDYMDSISENVPPAKPEDELVIRSRPSAGSWTVAQIARH